MWVLNGDVSRVYGNEEGWSADGIQYPGNWDKASFPGFQLVALTPQPSDPSLIVTGNAVEMVSGIPTQVWKTAPAPVPSPEEVAAAAAAGVRLLAQRALDQSDITVLRCVSAGIAVPAEWQSYRVALRGAVASGAGPLPSVPAFPAGS